MCLVKKDGNNLHVCTLLKLTSGVLLSDLNLKNRRRLNAFSAVSFFLPVVAAHLESWYLQELIGSFAIF